MENGQVSPTQPIAPAGLGTPGIPNVQTVYPAGSNGVIIQQAGAVPVEKKDIVGLVKTIVIVLVSLIAVTFIGLFIWMTVRYNEASEIEQSEINMAVADAVEENTTKMEAEFLEREKEPNRDFSGPADYGQLSFKYPKTWSVYVAKDASNGGDYEAYFNPIEVEEVSKDTINALRLIIRDKSFEEVVEEYRKEVEKKEAKLSVESVTIYDGTPANRYTGIIPKTDLNGIVVIFKIRDKTAILQTDSLLFENDFNNLINTITFSA